MKPWLLTSGKVLVAILVVIGIVQSVRKAAEELDKQRVVAKSQLDLLDSKIEGSTDFNERKRLQEKRAVIQQQLFSIWNISPWGMALSVVICMFGLLPAGIFWHRSLCQFGFHLSLYPTLATYFLGHLGKYVPGKAMVFVIRCGGLRSQGVPVSVSIVSIFTETLYLMAVASAVGGLALMLGKPVWWIATGAIALGAAAAIPTHPTLFRWVLSFLAKRRVGGVSSDIVSGIDWRLFRRGWLEMSIGWVLMGLAMWLVVWSILPTHARPSLWTWQAVMACIAASSLSVVAGFLSMLPGGFGVREYIVSLTLQPIIGLAPALAAAIWMRLVSLAAEFAWNLVLQGGTVLGFPANAHNRYNPKRCAEKKTEL